jgi:hypothetical protein
MDFGFDADFHEQGVECEVSRVVCGGCGPVGLVDLKRGGYGV